MPLHWNSHSIFSMSCIWSLIIDSSSSCLIDMLVFECLLWVIESWEILKKGWLSCNFDLNCITKKTWWIRNGPDFLQCQWFTLHSRAHMTVFCNWLETTGNNEQWSLNKAQSTNCLSFIVICNSENKVSVSWQIHQTCWDNDSDAFTMCKEANHHCL